MPLKKRSIQAIGESTSAFHGVPSTVKSLRTGTTTPPEHTERLAQSLLLLVSSRYSLGVNERTCEQITYNHQVMANAEV